MHSYIRSHFNRDSPDDCRSAVNIRAFPAFLQDRGEVQTATRTSGSPNELLRELEKRPQKK